MELISTIVWDKLNTFIGSKEVVYIRRRNLDFEGKRFNLDAFDVIVSGSKAEGLNLPGSDEDTMYVDKRIKVVPTWYRNLKLLNADFIMDTENVKPGFANLIWGGINLSRVGILGIYFSSMTEVDNRLYLSSLLFRDKIVKMAKDKIIFESEPHGPCVTYTVNKSEYDSMYCLSSKIWPWEAREWVERRRERNWPSAGLIKEIVEEGCLLVPIGNPLSQGSHMQWRISFSLAEKRLVFSFNHTQLLCYGLLKLFLKHVVESEEECKGLLCSYFLKTSLFYCIEEEGVEWSEHNLINCALVCIQRLTKWVREGYCPNYFIRSNNMMESKIFGERQKRLLEHLVYVCENGIETLEKIPCLSDSRAEIVRHSTETSLQNRREMYGKRNEFKCDLALFDINGTSYGSSVEVVIRNIERIDKLLVGQNVSGVDRLLLNLWAKKHQIILTQHLYSRVVRTGLQNKSSYKNLQMLSRYILKACTKYDTCTGLLQYATLCYLTGNFNKVISVSKFTLGKFGPSVMYVGPEAMVTNGYNADMCGKGYTIQHKRKHALACTYVVLAESRFYPEEIGFDIKHHEKKLSIMHSTFIPPRVYCYVLLFLAYHRTGRHDLGSGVLDKFFESIDDSDFISEPERPLVSALMQRLVTISSIDNHLEIKS